MFDKLKDKLKSALAVFSKQAEEEAEVQEEVIATETPLIEKESKEEKTDDGVIATGKKKKSDKETTSKKEKKGLKERTRATTEKKTESTELEEPKSDLVEDGKTLEPETKVEIKEEKPGFFEKLKQIFVKEEPVETKSEVAASAISEVIKIKESVKIEEEIKEKSGFFSKIKQSLTTKTISAEKFNELFWDLELILLENNVSVEVIERIKADLQAELVDKPLPRDVLKKIEETLKLTLNQILTNDAVDIVKAVKDKKLTEKPQPFVIAFFGVNGAGKTTSIAKLTYYLKKNKLSVVLAAGDTFRAAAIQQLQEHADKLQVPVIKQNYGADAAAVAFDAIKYAQKNKIDVVLIDTAGRLHSNTNLMAELEKIIRVTKPDLKLFVGESITGNDCIEQAKRFNELVQMDGAILTKADVDEKGGAPLSISYTIEKPILFLGVGQKYEDLEKFDKEKIISQLGL